MKKLILISTFLSTAFLIGCVGGPIQEIIDLANSRKIQVCTKGQSSACDSKYIITLDNVTLVSHNLDGNPLNPPHTVETFNGVVLSATVNGVTRYFGVAADWEDAWASISGLTDAQKDHALTQFFQGQFDDLGFLTPVNDTIPNPDPSLPPIDIIRYRLGDGTYFSQSSDSIKDVEALGANIEANRFGNLAETLESNYGLSTERAQVVAKNIAAYQKLSSRRSLTEKERNFFSTEVLGMNFKDAQNALTSGDAGDLNKLLENAALKNGTSPEQITLILNEIFL